MGARTRYRFEFHYRPGLSLPADRLARLVGELREVGATCFDPLPGYQCFVGTPVELADKVITVARRPDGTMAGFCSAVLLPVEGCGDVLHLGLTCVRPDDRGAGLTHLLTAKLMTRHVFLYAPIGRVWITSVACVLSSLGSVALNAEQVYPSPFGPAEPGAAHRAIAAAIDRRYRHKAAINAAARFDPKAFVFRGSVEGTVFEKRAADTRFHHRSPALNDFYLGLMAMENGDEVLQVGHVSPLTLLRHAVTKQLLPRLRALKPRKRLAAPEGGAA